MGFGLMMRDQHGAEINKAFRVSMHNPDMTWSLSHCERWLTGPRDNNE